MSLEFNATLRDKGQANDDKKKILLEVPVKELKGKVEELTGLVNKTVVITILPDSYSYTQKIDTSTNRPIQEWIVNKDGTAELVESEQTQLDIDGKGGSPDIKEVTKKVDKDIVDEYILKATTLSYSGIINPRDVVSRLKSGEDIGDIAERYEMSDSALLNELEEARAELAPFADSWDKHRDEIVFQEPTEDPEEPEDEAAADSDQAASDPVEDEKETEEPAKGDSDEKAADSDKENKPDGENTEPDVKAAEDDSDGEDGDVDPYA
ncbi:hypothetical protein [Candidatus Enterococcus ferrettii]|uniref:Uncharacterized protein n=1 Tax=Candidatus Enterococcus ferrettii TaxID=2815324 RepID=A0ABV0EI33_9ENTE|nr:hypothetical protein [Enterococcus sp. 665A]MBO1341864.1 hypothetical protein [Enterococcus sp. 665A]